MSNLNFQKYFDEDNYYYDSKYIITILETMLGINFEEIKRTVNDSKVLLTEEQIEAFLKQRLVEEDPELKQRIEERKLKQEKIAKERRKKSEQGAEEKLSFNFKPLTDEEIKEQGQAIADSIAIGRYQFEPYTLKYFNKYIGIVRSKLLTLLDIIEKIGNKNVTSVQDFMTELDIVLDENGNIPKEDIIRLLTPTIYNFLNLNKKVEEANELSTYLTFKMSEHSLMRDGWSESEVYPQKSLQNKDLYGFNGNENVQLSSRQEKERREKQKRNNEAGAKLILSLFD